MGCKDYQFFSPSSHPRRELYRAPKPPGLHRSKPADVREVSMERTPSGKKAESIVNGNHLAKAESVYQAFLEIPRMSRDREKKYRCQSRHKV